MTDMATGEFRVTLTPRQETPGQFRQSNIAKVFTGDLKATSQGEMLAAMGSVDGSGGYIAMERVQGTLVGRTGSFALQHSGRMERGVPTLVVTVVPDSGTGELSGLSGTMEIEAVQGTHIYRFSYSLGTAESLQKTAPGAAIQ